MLTEEQKRINKNNLAREWRNKNKDKISAHSKKWYCANTDMAKKHARVSNMKKFGLTVGDYDTMLSSQHGCCKICDAHYSKLTYALSVDHCHKTGKVRGLLCSNCNTAIGLMKENVGNILKLIDYINGK